MATEASSSPEKASADFDLNGAASQFSISLIKQKVHQLASEYDNDLERNYVLQIRTLLREVDHKRSKFNGTKNHLVEGLRGTLTSLQVNVDTINDAVSELDAMMPTWLTVIPRPSAMACRPPTPAVSPPQEHSIALLNRTAGAPAMLGNLTTPSSSFSGHNKSIPGPGPAQAQDTAQDETDSGSHTTATKRPRPDAEMDDNAANKKIKSSDSQPTSETSDMPRKIKMADVDPTEYIFRHAGRPGFFVIRCNDLDCTLRIAESDPFKLNRAFNHFGGKHFDRLQPESYIFENYAFQVEDATAEEVARRVDFPDGEVPECSPRSEIPVKTMLAQDRTQQPSTSDTSRNKSVASLSTPLKEIPESSGQDKTNGHKSPISSRKEKTTSVESSPRKSTESKSADSDSQGGDSSSSGSDGEEPKHNLRRQAKPSYKDMIHGRDWATPVPEGQTAPRRGPGRPNTRRSVERSSQASDTPRPKSARFATPLSNPPSGAKTQAADATTKPFGHTGEWPRRSAK